MSSRSSHQGSWEWAGGSSRELGKGGLGRPLPPSSGSPTPTLGLWEHRIRAVDTPALRLQAVMDPEGKRASQASLLCPCLCHHLPILPPSQSPVIRVPYSPPAFSENPFPSFPFTLCPPSPSSLSEPHALLLSSERFFSFYSPQ